MQLKVSANRRRFCSGPNVLMNNIYTYLSYTTNRGHFLAAICLGWIDLIRKSQNSSVPYSTMLHSEQKCAHFCSEWSIVGYRTGHSGISESILFEKGSVNSLSKLMKMHLPSLNNSHITSQFYTCEDSSAVVACANLWSYQSIKMIISAITLFSQDFKFDLINILWKVPGLIRACLKQFSGWCLHN